MLDADRNIEVASIIEEIGIYEEDKDCMKCTNPWNKIKIIQSTKEV